MTAKKKIIDRYPVMAIKKRSIARLHADPRNARAHDEASIAAISASLERFGQRKPIIVAADGIVKAGNGTLEAARRLGWVEIATAPAPIDTTEARAYALADNRTAELSSWDSGILAEELRAIQGSGIDVSLLGWSADDLAALLAQQKDPLPPPEFPNFDLDVTINCTCPKCGYEWSASKTGGAKQATGG